MIRGLLILFVCWLIGEGISMGLKIPIAGNVIGMVLLTLALKSKIIPLAAVQSVADTLIKNLAFLFIPPGVGLMLYGEALAKDWVAIVVGNCLSTFAVLGVVGWLQQRLGKT